MYCINRKKDHVTYEAKIEHKEQQQEHVHTKFKVTSIDEKESESKGISSSAKNRHSDDSGPGEKCGVIIFAKNIT